MTFAAAVREAPGSNLRQPRASYPGSEASFASRGASTVRSPASSVTIPTIRSIAWAVVASTCPFSSSKSAEVKLKALKPWRTKARVQYIDPEANSNSSGSIDISMRSMSCSTIRWSPPQNSLPTIESAAVTSPSVGSAAKALRISSTFSRDPTRSERNWSFHAAPLPSRSACSSRHGLFFVCSLRMRSYGSRIPELTSWTVGKMSRPWFSTSTTTLWRMRSRSSGTATSDPEAFVTNRSKSIGRLRRRSKSSGMRSA